MEHFLLNFKFNLRRSIHTTAAVYFFIEKAADAFQVSTESINR